MSKELREERKFKTKEELSTFLDVLATRHNLKLKKFLESNSFMIENELETWFVKFIGDQITLYHQNSNTLKGRSYKDHPQFVRNFNYDAVKYIFKYIYKHQDYKFLGITTKTNKRKQRMDMLFDQIASTSTKKRKIG